MLDAGRQPVLSLDFDDNYLVAGFSKDHSLREWSLATEACIRDMRQHSDDVTGVLLAGSQIITCSRDKLIKFWVCSKRGRARSFFRNK